MADNKRDELANNSFSCSVQYMCMYMHMYMYM